MRTVMQIGLHTSFEWAYLTRQNWPAGYHHDFHILPSSFTADPSPFAFYGIDCSPESISYCASKSEEWGFTDCKFICIGISDTATSKGKWSWKKQGWHTIDINVTSIEYLFVPIPLLIEMLGLASLDVLALDIDNYEYIVLRTIATWPIKPYFISVEVHGTDSQDKILRDTLSSAGYSLIKECDKYPEKVKEYHFQL